MEIHLPSGSICKHGHIVSCTNCQTQMTRPKKFKRPKAFIEFIRTFRPSPYCYSTWDTEPTFFFVRAPFDKKNIFGFFRLNQLLSISSYRFEVSRPRPLGSIEIRNVLYLFEVSGPDPLGSTQILLCSA